MRGGDRGALPGLGLTLGLTLLYLSLLVLVPLAALFLKAAGLSWSELVGALANPRTLAALRLSLVAAFAAAAINLVFGLLVAWVLERYDFPGRRLFEALVDLPFALPTAVAGITLASLYAPGGWLGRWLAPLGLQVAYTPLGVVVALVFVGLPFVIRTVQPVVAQLEPALEEAAATLGASRAQTFRRVVLPQLWPAAVAGFSLAFARGLGEYGSVIFIAGNLPLRSEIAPLLIMVQLEQYDYAGAAAIAVAFLLLAFALLLAIHGAAAWSRRASRQGLSKGHTAEAA